VGPARRGLPKGQRYRNGTMTVETSWPGLTVTDFLDAPPPHDHGVESTTLVRVLEGTAKARVEFAPRPEFGQVQIRLQPVGDRLLVLGSNEPIELRSPGVEWDIYDDGGQDSARATVDLAALGGRLELELRCGIQDEAPSGPGSVPERLT